MPKGSEELTSARREEIVDACAGLYRTMGFKDITVKQIGSATSFSRTSIYNYFETKEEIFLALLQREYEHWTAELNAAADRQPLSRDELAQALAASLEKRAVMLKLMAMNLYDIECCCRMERLVEFKAVYGGSIDAVGRCLDACARRPSEAEKQEFITLFFPFVYGIYPYTAATDKQREAMRRAGVCCRMRSIYEIALAGAEKLLP